MKIKSIKLLLSLSLISLATGCNGFFDKDNSPTPSALTTINNEVHPRLMWNKNVNHGVENENLKLAPVIANNMIFSADKNGNVTATDKTTGVTIWQVFAANNITAGPSVSNGLVYIGTQNGKLIALHQEKGSRAFSTQLSSEILSPPAASNGYVLVKTSDGLLTALNDQTGKEVWHYQQSEPSMILRGGSTPKITNQSVIAGFANGNLSHLSLNDGSVIWEQPIAEAKGSFAVDRMIDINADPVIYKDRVYVASYQGKLAALDLSSGKTLWSQDLSAFTGLTIADNKVFVSGSSSYLYALDAITGDILWKQDRLAYRNITAPASIGNYIVVGDEQGYLHWLNKADGHFVARNQVNQYGIVTSPITDDNNLFVFTKDGHLAAYELS